MYQKVLESIGLQPKEALVYTALLKLGETSIKPLLREAGLKRGNLYDVLYALEKKGLCDLTIQRRKTRFRAASPNNLLDIAEQERFAKDRAVKELEYILPKLSADFRIQANKPVVAYYDGIEGIKKINKMILEQRHPLKIMASYVDRNNAVLKELLEQQRHKQKLLGISHQAIVSGKHYQVDRDRIADYEKRAIGIRKLDNFELSSQILIFGNNVAISALSPQITTTYIENESVAKSLAIVFDQLWDKASPV